MGYETTLMFGTMRSGKSYKNKGNKGPEYSPLISPLGGDKEGIAKVSLRSVFKLIR